jgi:hypothetical protein
MTITEFLEARIDEDEAQAKYVHEYGDTGGAALFAPARVLAECATKRAILGMYDTYANAVHESVGIAAVGARCGQEVTADVLGAIAAVYKDHPDYRQEWADGTR